VIQGDHGPGSHLDFYDARTTDLEERVGILLAIRAPEGLTPMLADRMGSPVNAMRAVLNMALGTALPTLPDRSYYSTWSEPLAFIPVGDEKPAQLLAVPSSEAEH
jgi:hypothetical protein